jgi:maltose phosphorylase
MKEGWYHSFLTLKNGTEIAVSFVVFYQSFRRSGIINYEITPLNKDSKIVYKPYIDAGVTEDANWEEKFWEPLDVKNQEMKLL